MLLLVSYLVLLISTHRGPSGLTHGADQNPSIGTLLALGVSSRAVNSLGFLFGRQDQNSNHSSGVDHPILVKRSRPPPGYSDLICAGGKYLETIKAAFDGKHPGKEFTPEELNNGWSTTPKIDEEDVVGVERRWKTTFQGLFGQTRGYPLQSEIKPISLVQDKKYTTFLDRDLDLLTDPRLMQEPTNAYCEGLYYPSRSIMISTSAYSPATIIQDRNPRLGEENRNRLLPTISHLSDLMWMAWNTVSPNPAELRFMAVDKVRNDDTLAVMDYLFLRDKKDNRNIPWPGLEYRGDSEEGKALLATANGRGTAWLLINHAQKLKGNGELKVNIFSVFGDYCMLWDLDSQSPRDISKRGAHIDRHINRRLPHAALDRFEHHKRQNGAAHGEVSLETQHDRAVMPDVEPLHLYLLPSNGSLVKREQTPFEYAVCLGQDMLERIRSAIEGHEAPGKEFRPSDLNNGWTRRDSTMGLNNLWVQFFDKELGQGKAPTPAFVNYVRLDQDKEFKNADGEIKQPLRALGVGTPTHETQYMPQIGAIIVKNMVSPMNVFQKYLKKQPPQEMPSTDDIVDKYTPPLSRWSDITWTVYEELSGGQKNLQYVGHENIIGPSTRAVVKGLLEERRTTPNAPLRAPPFPGLTFGMDTEEGQALLGTPNGVGTARLLIDRAKELGKRDLKVTVWSYGPYLDMVFNMVPIKPVASESHTSSDTHSTTATVSR
ncbi:MAG: hypothetical protein Q9207_007800 [Kuettlingeria erythrocarpa]